MKVNTFVSDNINTIQVISYNPSEYKHLSALMGSMGTFYPWYYYHKGDDHVLVHYGGWLEGDKTGFDPIEWKYKINIKEEKDEK